MGSPFLFSIYYSLTNWKIVPPTPRVWVGLENYGKLTGDAFFRSATWVSIEMTVIPVVGSLLLGGAFALLLDRKFIGRSVLRTLLLFCLPAASFALTNTLGGLGGDFGASERFVALVAGIGSTAAGIAGSLLIPKVIERLAPRLTYLAIGSLGALFTLSIIGLPKVPLVFAIALIGQNLFQAAAFVVESTIVFRTIGPDNPLAATQFAVLNAATCLPIAYMQAVDGRGYGHGGLVTMLATDAALSLAACALLLPLVLWWGRTERAPAASPAELNAKVGGGQFGGVWSSSILNASYLHVLGSTG